MKTIFWHFFFYQRSKKKRADNPARSSLYEMSGIQLLKLKII